MTTIEISILMGTTTVMGTITLVVKSVAVVSGSGVTESGVTDSAAPLVGSGNVTTPTGNKQSGYVTEIHN